MMKKYIQFPLQPHFKALLALIVTICLLFITTTVLAATVNINDQARVLDQNKVRSAAQNLPYPVNIYTVNNFTGTSSDFDQQARSHITSPDLIVIAIDTVHHHLAIVGGSKVPLSNSQYQEAISAFQSNYSSGGYTGATIAAINALQSSLSSGSGNGSGNAGQGSSNSSGFSLSGFGLLCCIGFLVLAAIAVFGVLIGRRRGFLGGRPMGGPMNAPFQQPYNQGYPPGNYGQGYYGPGYPQGQGMNPWAAGGLGAAAGGLLGYELGREQGEDQAREQGQNDGGDFGGGASGDFGGGGGGDFGGGSSGDFGGGGGGDFGGGGGGDFGGGGSGNF